MSAVDFPLTAGSRVAYRHVMFTEEHREVQTPTSQDRLMITLWDFTWYTRTGPGEPFEDLDKAAQEAVDRGYNTIRICAMPFLLFESGIDSEALVIEPLGGDYAQRVRWYDVKHTTTISAREHLLELFRVCQRHDLRVIISSWEYQQSPSFAQDPAWYEVLYAVPVEERPRRMAQAHSKLMTLLKDEGFEDRVAYVELHNEAATGNLASDLDGVGHYSRDAIREFTTRLEPAIDVFKQDHPHVPFTVNWARVPVGVLELLPENMDVLAVHPYVYGVLDTITTDFGLRLPIEELDESGLRREGILRDGAPSVHDWKLPAATAWKQKATIVAPGEIYVHDWCDPQAFDRYLYERYALHHTEMLRVLGIWLDAAQDYSEARGIPMVFGEGWVGYTPLHGRFEEDAIGREFCRIGVRESVRVGAWGTIVCSNAAPHHPMWEDTALQQECSAIFLASSQD